MLSTSSSTRSVPPRPRCRQPDKHHRETNLELDRVSQLSSSTISS